jgi:putative SOS response-associated peptidase YedK
MPLILDPADYDRWLDPEASVQELRALLTARSATIRLPWMRARQTRPNFTSSVNLHHAVSQAWVPTMA